MDVGGAGPRVLMLAAENDALPGGKVGGIGDVVRGVSPALAALGCEVTVLTPGYGALANRPEACERASLRVTFRGLPERVTLLETPPRVATPGVRHLVVEHPLFATCGRGRIYCHDPPDSPFATDASKFALLCTSALEALVAEALGPPPDILHLHDWHAGLVPALIRFVPRYAPLAGLGTVFSIHNLALQGVRPLRGHPSAFESWFPGLDYDPGVIGDPRWAECVNPMATGIRLAGRVHTVSPTYAEEILAPSAVEARGLYGGEGLEGLLREASEDGRLAGILNGCDYPEARRRRPGWRALLGLLRAELLRLAGSEPVFSPAHFVTERRLAAWSRATPRVLLTSVGRVTEQKVRLLREPDARGRPSLEGVLEALGRSGLYIFLGAGDPDYEHFLTSTSARFANFAFLRGYSEAAGDALYAAGDLFLMPSSYEPCGISQMLAMRMGQPCLAHAVGGLRDTIRHGANGFLFAGRNPTEQAGALVAACREALALHERQPETWQRLRETSAAARFTWGDTARAYVERLYRPRPGGSPVR